MNNLSKIDMKHFSDYISFYETSEDLSDPSRKKAKDSFSLEVGTGSRASKTEQDTQLQEL